MELGCFRFEDFRLDPVERQLLRQGRPVELNGRYLDALVLLVREQGRLVSKDRFLDEVWRGIPVTDEALTQCIRTLRRQLGDDASRPHFIETVPKHGYRFIAQVETADGEGAFVAADTRREPYSLPLPGWRQALTIGVAGTIGAGIAGLLGGLFYGFAGASQPLAPGMGAISVLLVLVCLTIAVALIGGAGVSFGIAAGNLAPRNRWIWMACCGALGGTLVGGLVKLLGLDAFNLLLGQSPGDITGAAEGALLGATVGLSAWAAGLGCAAPRLRRGMAIAGCAGAAAGAVIALSGGSLMGGSLDLLASSFPESRIRLDQIGLLFGESGFGPVGHAVTAALEGAIFGACIVGAMIVARRS